MAAHGPSTPANDSHPSSALVSEMKNGARSTGDDSILQDTNVEDGIESKKYKPGEKWKSQEVHEIPYNNFKLVIPGFMLTMFLAALDQTIVAVALPTIVNDIGGATGYSWVGSAYLLMAASLCPLYGKLSQIVGRKPVLFFSIGIFLFGSALCGAAQNFAWLAISRGIQGLGGGGIVQLVQITVSDITSLEERAKYGGLVGSVFGIATVVGPLVGGVLADHVSWRWCFWINLPTGGAAAVVLFFSLHLNPTKRRSVVEVAREFDFAGLFLLVASVVLILVGFQNADSASWQSSSTIAPLVIGCVLLVVGSVNEVYTSKDSIIPPRLFRTRTTTSLLIAAFLHSILFFGSSYFVPLYFQILGASATMAGARQLPLSLGGAFVAVVTGGIVSKTGKYKAIMLIGWVLMAVGFGTMIMLDEGTSVALQEIYILICGVGLGCNFVTALIALQSAMPQKDMATSTATFGLVRTLGGAVGIAVCTTIFASELSRRLSGVTIYQQFASGNSQITNDFSGLSRIEPVELRQTVLHEFTRSLSTIWIVSTPFAVVGLILTLFIREYSLKQTVVHGKANDAKVNDDAEGAGASVIVEKAVADIVSTSKVEGA